MIYTVKNLELPAQKVDARSLKANFCHLRGLPIPSLDNVIPKILIGLDQAKFLLGRQVHEGKNDGPIGCKTRLRWIVYGKANAVSILPDNADKATKIQLLSHEVKVSSQTKITK